MRGLERRAVRSVPARNVRAPDRLFPADGGRPLRVRSESGRVLVRRAGLLVPDECRPEGRELGVTRVSLGIRASYVTSVGRKL